jgi:hypothetical protein
VLLHKQNKIKKIEIAIKTKDFVKKKKGQSKHKVSNLHNRKLFPLKYFLV